MKNKDCQEQITKIKTDGEALRDIYNHYVPTEAGESLQSYIDRDRDTTKPYKAIKWDEKAEQQYYIKQLCDINTEYYYNQGNIKAGQEWQMNYKPHIMFCGSYLLFFKKNNTDKLKLKDATFCKWRGCPMCEWRKARLNEKRAVQKFDEIQLKKISRDGRGYDIIGFELTVPNCTGEELAQTVDQMLIAWSKLRAKTINGKRLFQRKKDAARDINKTPIFAGYIRSLEITRNNDTKSISYGTFHPHFHVRALVNKQYFKNGIITGDKMLKIWQECLKSAGYKNYTQVTNKPIPRKAKDLHQALKYTVGGLYKHENEDAETDRGIFTQKTDFDAETLRYIIPAIKNRQLIACGGELEGAIRNEIATTDGEAEGIGKIGEMIGAYKDRTLYRTAKAIKDIPEKAVDEVAKELRESRGQKAKKLKSPETSLKEPTKGA